MISRKDECPLRAVTFRHSFATHLPEQGWHVRQVQALLGHRKLETTMVYTHLTCKPAAAVTSLLDRLDASSWRPVLQISTTAPVE